MPLFWHARPPKTDREHFELTIEALGVIIENQEAIMTGQSNLSAALADLSDKLTAHDVAVQKAIGDLKTAFAAGDEAAFQSAADALSAMSSKVASETADLAAADAPPIPAPAPAPADPAPAPVAPAPETPADPSAPAPAPDPSAPVTA